MTSIRRALLVTLLASVAAVTLLAALLVYRLARGELDALLDDQLRQIALALRSQSPDRGALASLGREGLGLAVQIWTPDGERLFVSPPDAGLPDLARLGFDTVDAPGGPWRVYAAQLSGFVVQVGQPLRVRQRLAVAAATRTLTPVLLILPLLALLVWRIVERALAPLDRLARAVASRRPESLEPIAERATPEEALPLVRSLNDLLRRLDAALSAQRSFVADAAHELRTPLAALQLQVQLVERAGDAPERAAALADLRAGLERTTHVVQQLLTLARAEPDAGARLAGEPVPLDELVAQVVADHAVLAEARGLDLGATAVAADAVVRGDAGALRTLLGNLVENAIRHTPRGGRIDVSAGVAAGAPFLAVEDTGPGIPEAERTRVFDRFYRRGDGAAGGAGLGLAIVKAIAERHGAAVALGDAPGGGLAVRVSFPAHPAPHPGREALRVP